MSMVKMDLAIDLAWPPLKNSSCEDGRLIAEAVVAGGCALELLQTLVWKMDTQIKEALDYQQYKNIINLLNEWK